MEPRYVMLRLYPNQDLKRSLIEFCKNNGIQSGAIVSAVGSFSTMRVRIADGKSMVEDTQNRELLSLCGTLTGESVHLHVSAINSTMEILGGHLMEGCIIHTTLELVILDLSDLYKNKREYDSQTGYDELVVIPR